MVRPGLAVVIPCHNEAHSLGEVLAVACREAHVILVDDRSTDASAVLAVAYGATVVVSEAPGYDGAISTGLRRAVADGCAWVITMDADGEHDPDLIAAFADLMRETCPIGWRSRRTEADRLAVFDQHDRIAEAIEAGDPLGAEAAMDAHFGLSLRALANSGFS